MVHAPEAYCSDAAANNNDNGNRGEGRRASSSNNADLPPIPLVFALHGFGAPPGMFTSAFAPFVASHQFALVQPLGSGNPKSFNGVHCCGSAMKRGVDDVAFLEAVVRELEEEEGGEKQPTTAAAATTGTSLGSIEKLLSLRVAGVVGTGFSNGAFLLEHAVSRSPGLFSAVLPVAGHLYAPPNLTSSPAALPFSPSSSSLPSSSSSLPSSSSSMTHHNHHRPPAASPPISVYLSHSLDDGSVRFSGCCQASSHDRSTRCCCGISERSPLDCVSAEEVFERWLHHNRCQGKTSGVVEGGESRGSTEEEEEEAVVASSLPSSLTLQSPLSPPSSNKRQRSKMSSSSQPRLVSTTCWEGTGCDSQTKLCAHKGLPHVYPGTRRDLAARTSISSSSLTSSSTGGSGSGSSSGGGSEVVVVVPLPPSLEPKAALSFLLRAVCEGTQVARGRRGGVAGRWDEKRAVCVCPSTQASTGPFCS